MGVSADGLVLKAACERCGSSSDLHGTGCRHATLCVSCGSAMARSGDCCPVCAAPIASLIREYNVLVDTTGEKQYTIGKFTTGVPPFSDRENAGSRSWSLHPEGQQGRQPTGNIWENCSNRKSCILEDDTGDYQYQGQIQGLQSAASTYYLLMMHGKDVHAVPADSWYNFSKISQYKQLTLEEAEEKMSRRRSTATGYGRWMMKAATNGAAAFSSDVTQLDDANEGETDQVHLKKGNKNGDENKSDKGSGEERAHVPMTKGREEEGSKDRDFDLDDEIEKGDDWEHEEIFTDDDEAVDVDPEEGGDLADPEIPAPPEIKQDDNEKHGGVSLSKSGKELKKLLRRAAGQNESDDDDEDTDEDESPSPVLAPKQQDQLKSEPQEDNHSKPTVLGHPYSTPHVSKSNQKRRQRGDDSKTCATPKKPKIEPDTKKIVVKEETSCSLEPTSEPFASARSDTNVSPITVEEIRVVLRLYAPIAMRDFSKDFMPRFSPRLRSPEDREVFLANLRKISHLQKINGQKYIILLEEYK
uniref:Transcription initiation factor IIF subunit alpha n=1 Tax=Oryza barthii TaxID=65489 RepID=A0A0D3FGA9_9ORYZ